MLFSTRGLKKTDAAAVKKRPSVALIAMIAAFLAAALFVIPGCAPNPETEAVRNAQVGDVVQFGDYQWRVLAMENKKALLVTEGAIDLREFDDAGTNYNWENCSLRGYLNGEFYDAFNDDQKKAIVETTVSTPDNPEYGTSGGNDTTDSVFLLSIDEAESYFATDEDRLAKFDLAESNQYAEHNGKPCGWWLRSPGADELSAAGVSGDGSMNVRGRSGGHGGGGIRPAVWVSL